MKSRKPRKATLEVSEATHSKIRQTATKSNRSTKEITSVLLSYALEKLESGAISIAQPCAIEKGVA